MDRYVTKTEELDDYPMYSGIILPYTHDNWNPVNTSPSTSVAGDHGGPGPKLVCDVCGDVAYGKHYGINVSRDESLLNVHLFRLVMDARASLDGGGYYTCSTRLNSIPCRTRLDLASSPVQVRLESTTI